METRECQNCHIKFVIEPEDFEFYGKMDVPAPDICHECRSQERTAFRNESVLYKRKCDMTGKDIISIYSPDKPYKVYDQNVWWGDDWDALDYGRDYDFNKSFFEQFDGLLHDVPRLSIINRQSTASDYCNYSNSNRNCYLCFGGHENENCAYCWYNWKDNNCLDCLSVIKSELTYESHYGSDLYKCAYTEYAFDSMECYFCYNIRGCQHCFLSANLRNKSYYFQNEQFSKEDYEAKVQEYLDGTRKGLEKTNKLFAEIKNKAIRPPLFQKNCMNCTGGDIMYSKNIKFGFDGEYSEDSKYAFPKFSNIYNCMDTNKMGYDRSDYCYMTIGCAGLNNCRFCDTCWNNFGLTYCNLCFSSENLFGCVGLRHKKYCVLNKQYSKEEYQTLAAKITEQMKNSGEWGKFPPPALSQFAYNESTAQEYSSLTQSEAEKLGYKWKEPDEKNHKIGGDVLACEHAGRCEDRCTKAFKLIPQELEFYKQLNLPIPVLCPNCRHHARLKNCNPLKLWHRKCMKSGCTNEFETSYAPERPEIVYCETCYQQEVV